MRNIDIFLFDFAQYSIVDKNGNKVVLRINYKNNSYEINGNVAVSSEFEEEINKVAKHLLKRKHGVNRANYLNK